MQRSWRLQLGPVLCLCLSLAAATGIRAQAVPYILSVSTGSAPAGSGVTLSGSGLFPGGYAMTVRWDGTPVETFSIPFGDTFSRPFVVPPGAGLGTHTIQVCAFCDDPEFEVSGSVNLNVTATSSGGNFDVQIRAIELTQGVRGAIPERTPPSDPATLPTDDSVHVIDRRTVVRVYPWVDLDSGTTSSLLTCELWGYRDGAPLPGSPLRPVNPRLAVVEGTPLAQQRSNPRISWNFVLPAEWVRHNSTPGLEYTAFTIDFKAHVNPPGLLNWPERTGAETNNEAFLNAQEFVYVRGRSFPPLPMIIHPIFVDFTDTTGGSTVFKPMPTVPQMTTCLHRIGTVFPIAATVSSRAGMLILPVRRTAWTGTLGSDRGKRRFRRDMVREFFPGGDFDAPRRDDFYCFLFDSGSNCSGHAYLRSSFAMSTVCDWVFAQELGHAVGQSHAGNGHGESLGGGYDSSYPGVHGELEPGTYGFDVYTLAPRPAAAPANPEGSAHDYMSYGGGPLWTSLYTWDRLANRLGTPEIWPKAPLSSHPQRIFSGWIDANGEHELDFVFAAAPPDSAPSGPFTSYDLVFRDAFDNVLAQVPIPASNGQHVHGDEGEVFDENVDPPVGWQSVALEDGGNLLASFARSDNPPSVTLNPPAVNPWPATGSVGVDWIASDPDDDPLRFRLEGSVDGLLWFGLAPETDATNATVTMENVPAGGGALLLRVQASDGLDVAISDPQQIALDPRPPSVVILYPQDGGQYLVHQPVALTGHGGDWQDGALDDAQLEWLIDGQLLGSGAGYDVTLEPGLHQIQLTGTNSVQLTGQMTVQIEIVAMLALPQLITPSPGAQQLPTEVEFMWTPVPAANSYAFELALDAQMTQLVFQDEGLWESSLQIGGLDPFTQYHWRVRPQGPTETGDWTPVSSFTTGSPSATEPPSSLGHALLLHPPAPNPFNPRTELHFELTAASEITLAVYDLAGRHVRTLLHGWQPAGTGMAVWDGRDSRGVEVGSGVYMVRLRTGSQVSVRKLALVR